MRLFFSNIYYYLYLIDVNNLIWGNFWVPLFVMQYFVICTKWYNYVKSTTIYLPRLRSYCILFSLYYIWFRDLKTHYCMHTHFPVEVRYVYFFSMWCTCRALSISLSISWKAIIHTGGSLVHLVGWVHNFIRYTAQCHISRTYHGHGYYTVYCSVPHYTTTLRFPLVPHYNRPSWPGARHTTALEYWPL